MLFQSILAIFTGFHVNYVTADLLKVDTNCETLINNFFMNCEECTTIAEQIEFIFLYTVPDELTARNDRIVREYIEHLHQAIIWTRFKTPETFCTEFVQSNAYLNETVVGCLAKLNDKAPEIFAGLNYMDPFYYKLALNKDYPMFYVSRYIEEVQKSVDVNENYLNGINTPALFCTMRICDYEIKSDIPDVISDRIMAYTKYIKMIFLHASLQTCLYENSKKYIDYVYKAIDVESTITRIMSPISFCNYFYSESKENKVCIATIKNHNWTTGMDEKEYLEYMFYYLSDRTTIGGIVRGKTTNYTFKYLEELAFYLEYSSNDNIINTLSPLHFCIRVALK